VCVIYSEKVTVDGGGDIRPPLSIGIPMLKRMKRIVANFFPSSVTLSLRVCALLCGPLFHLSCEYIRILYCSSLRRCSIDDRTYGKGVKSRRRQYITYDYLTPAQWLLQVTKPNRSVDDDEENSNIL